MLTVSAFHKQNLSAIKCPYLRNLSALSASEVIKKHLVVLLVQHVNNRPLQACLDEQQNGVQFCKRHLCSSYMCACIFLVCVSVCLSCDSLRLKRPPGFVVRLSIHSLKRSAVLLSVCPSSAIVGLKNHSGFAVCLSMLGTTQIKNRS
jgi:hypothetical protein